YIGLLAGVIYALVAGLARWGLWPRFLPWLPWACALAFSAALGYGLLAGFEVPVRRACVMVAMVLLWRLRFRHLGVVWPLLLSFNAVLIFEPLVTLQPGFWLSFAAVGILILIFSGRLGAWRWWQSWTRAQWLIAVGLLPILLALNLPISLSGPFANLLAVPWVSVIVLPPALLGTLLLPVPVVGEGLLWRAGGALQWLFVFLDAVAAALPAWLPSAVPIWAWWLSLLGALLLLLPKGVPMRPLGWPLLLLCVFPPLESVPEGQVEVLQLDVGQGLAILLRTRNHTLLYDAGPRFGEFDIGQRVVVPAMRKAGVRHLDLMLISHSDADHAGGAAAVHQAFPVSRVLSGELARLAPAATRRPIVRERCTLGVGWRGVFHVALGAGARRQPRLLHPQRRRRRRASAAGGRYRRERRARGNRQRVRPACPLVAVAASRQPDLIVQSVSSRRRTGRRADFPWSQQCVRSPTPVGHGALSRLGHRQLRQCRAGRCASATGYVRSAAGRACATALLA
ncbi:DNA internalization-related competence protein ComEC/Rec2, partial [Pseudomonas syringae pv. aptata]